MSYPITGSPAGYRKSHFKIYIPPYPLYTHTYTLLGVSAAVDLKHPEDVWF